MSKMDVATERKNQIVRATVDCIAKHGYHNFSMQDVARAAGVSKGIIHYYFLNKDDLMTSVLDKVATDIEQILHADMSTSASPQEKLEVFINICLDIVITTKEYYQVNMDFWTHINQKDKVKKLIAKHYKSFRDTCSQVIVEGIRSGAFSPVDPNQYSAYIVAIVDGISLQWLFDETAFEHDAMATQVCQIVMKSLLA